jgi:hypothetical protein
MRTNISCVLLALTCLGYAQTTIKGTVTSKGDGNPLNYVTINTDSKKLKQMKMVIFPL